MGKFGLGMGLFVDPLCSYDRSSVPAECDREHGSLAPTSQCTQNREWTDTPNLNTGSRRKGDSSENESEVAPKTFSASFGTINPKAYLLAIRLDGA
jgi:hypothetical protein